MGMITQNFEIKVALLGYVSVGKTTVLNALFRDKFSEVSMRRTTAGVNFFRVVAPGPEEALDGEVEGRQSSATDPEQWSVLPDEPTRTAADVLKEIEESNRELREAGRIEEKWFNIKLDRPLCEMRKDTQLVIVDVPGINEAETSSIYKKYTNDNWKNFDCVVAVMDARQGVNTEEQLEILKLIKTNLATKKQLPVIIISTKSTSPKIRTRLYWFLRPEKRFRSCSRLTAASVNCKKSWTERVTEQRREAPAACTLSLYQCRQFTPSFTEQHLSWRTKLSRRSLM